MITKVRLVDESRTANRLGIHAPIPVPLNSNPGAEMGLSGWSWGGGTAEADTTIAHAGGASAKFTPDGVSTEGGVIDLSMTDGLLTIGNEYVASVWVYSELGFDQVRVSVVWFDVNDSGFAQGSGPVVSVPPGEWTELTVISEAPEGSDWAAPTVDVLGTPAITDVIWFDDLEIYSLADHNAEIAAFEALQRDAELIIYPRRDIAAVSLDLGFPEIRSNLFQRTGSSGDLDLTSKYGSRSVSLELTLLDTPAALLREIGTFLEPATRPYLHVLDTEWSEECRIELRVETATSPFSGPRAHIARDVQIQWNAPNGVWEGELRTRFVSAESDLVAGLTFPITMPLSFPATSPSGFTQIENPGAECHFKARLYGPCSGPELTNETTGETIRFKDDLVISAGDYVEIDTREETAFYLSSRSASRLNYLDFVTSAWWTLRHGINHVRYHPNSSEIGSSAYFDFTPIWLL